MKGRKEGRERERRERERERVRRERTFGVLGGDFGERGGRCSSDSDS